MKYLKKFEKKALKYIVGDYVYVNAYRDVIYFCRIIDVNTGSNIYVYFYMVESFYVDSSDTQTFYIDEKDIKRKMTLEEIEEYEAKIAASKYNL